MSRILVDQIRSNSASADAITLADNGTCTANITSLNGGQFANRNIIINGEFLVSQRASSATSVSGSANFTYNSVDRFVYGRSTDAVVNLAQEDDAPLGFKKCLQLRVTTAATSTSYARIVYRIEDTDVYRFGFGQSGTRFLTLSFYHKHTQAGTNCVMIQNPSYNRSYIAEYTQSVANTWERATITFPVDTGNHWSPSGGRGMQIQWGLTNADAQGSANAWTSSNIVVTSNQYNHLGAVDNYFRLTGIQLELGSVATDFEHRSFGQELSLCQRYYYKETATYYPATGYGTNPGTNCLGVIGQFCTMRSSATVTLGTASYWGSGPTVGSQTSSFTFVYGTTTSSNGPRIAGYELSAEL